MSFTFDPDLFGPRPYRAVTKYNMIQALRRSKGLSRQPNAPSSATAADHRQTLVETEVEEGNRHETGEKSGGESTISNATADTEPAEKHDSEKTDKNIERDPATTPA